LPAQKDQGIEKNRAAVQEMFDYVQALKIKRFTEIFYMVYRNMHLIPRFSEAAAAKTFSRNPSKVLMDASAPTQSH
jgi:hypothetical protein